MPKSKSSRTKPKPIPTMYIKKSKETDFRFSKTKAGLDAFFKINSMFSQQFSFRQKAKATDFVFLR